MGTVSGRSLGNVRGRVGSNVFTTWKKVYVIKMRPGRRRKGKKDLIISEQKMRIKLMSQLLKRFSKMIKIGFKAKNQKSTGYNLAYEHNLEHAIAGKYPYLEIDFSKLIMSRGNREGVWSPRLFFDPGCKIRLSWQIPELCDHKTIGQDIGIVVLYHPAEEFVYEFALKRVTTVRSNLTHTIGIEKYYKHDIFYVWMFFMSPDGKQTSNSEYFGCGALTE